MGYEISENEVGESGSAVFRKWRLPDHLYVDDQLLRGESEENVRWVK